jgi:hypothetical protein
MTLTEGTLFEKVWQTRYILAALLNDAVEEQKYWWEEGNKDYYDGWVEYAHGIGVSLSLIDIVLDGEENVGA